MTIYSEIRGRRHSLERTYGQESETQGYLANAASARKQETKRARRKVGINGLLRRCQAEGRDKSLGKARVRKESTRTNAESRVAEYGPTDCRVAAIVASGGGASHRLQTPDGDCFATASAGATGFTNVECGPTNTRVTQVQSTATLRLAILKGHVCDQVIFLLRWLAE